MTHMAAPQASTKTSLQQRLSDHARTHWPQLTAVTVRFRGAFAYVQGELPDGDTMPLMRLRYGGSAARWGFAMYLASKDGYEDAVLPTGAFPDCPKTPSTVPPASTSATLRSDQPATDESGVPGERPKRPSEASQEDPFPAGAWRSHPTSRSPQRHKDETTKWLARAQPRSVTEPSRLSRDPVGR